MEDNELIRKPVEKKESMVPYPDNTLYIINAGRLSLDKCLSLARDILSEELEEEVKIIELTHDTKDDKDVKSQQTLLLGGMTTQGPIVTQIKGGGIQIDIPYLSTPWDISMCFAICQAAKQLKPDCIVIMNDEAGHEFSLIDENKVALFNLFKQNMEALLDGCKKGNSIGVCGLNKEFYFSPRLLTERYKGLKKDQKIIRLFQMFLELQWDYNDYDTASLMQVTDPGDDKPYTMRILTNAGNYFIGNCFKLALMDSEKGIMKVEADDFRKYVKDNKYIRYVDDRQFLIHKMKKTEWDKFVKEAPGEYIPKRHTYILKWNPSISSFTLDTARRAHEECKHGFHTNWSVYDYKKAKDGDCFYMVRVGEGKTGVIWKGFFTSDPYEDKDWAGDPKKKRRYVEIDVHDHSDPDGEPFISTEVLKKAIPDFDWEKGHSGEMLTDEQEIRLEELWEKV